MSDPFSIDGDIGGHAEEDDETVVEHLKRVWCNERCAPNLLHYEGELVDLVKGALDAQQSYISSKRKTVVDESSIFMLKLLELEVDRIRFVLRGYLRARMCKIQRFHMHLLSDSSEMARMSEQEAKVCRAYTDAIAEHHNSSFIGNIPENLQGLHSDEMIARPDMDAHVFIRVLRDVGAIEVEGEDVELLKDEIVLVNYSHVQGLVESGDAAMV